MSRSTAYDLESGVVRIVGDVQSRYAKDPLCILVGCRLASERGLALDPRTKQAMWSHKMRLVRVAPEQVAHELTLLLLGDHVHDALMDCVNILGSVLPEIVAMKGFDQCTPYHIYDVWEHTAWVVQRSPRTPLARWAALLHDSGKPGAFFMDGNRGHFYGHALLSVKVARPVLERMGFDPAFVKDALTLVRMHDDTILATPDAVQEALERLEGDVDLFRLLIGLKRADAMAQSDLAQPRLDLAYALERMLDDMTSANCDS